MRAKVFFNAKNYFLLKLPFGSSPYFCGRFFLTSGTFIYEQDLGRIFKCFKVSS